MSALHFLMPLLFLGVVLPVFSQETVRLTFQGAGSLTVIEKANLRVRENGRYIGYLYKEARGYYSLESTTGLTNGGTEYRYSGRVYVLEDQKRDNRQAMWIDAVVETVLTATDYGYYRTDSAMPYPRTRGFPVLSNTDLETGVSWREYGEQVVIPREGARATRIEFYCEFKYQGVATYLDRTVHVINAQYATRYRRGEDPNGEPTLSGATGKHMVAIYIDASGSGWMFLRDQVDERFTFSDGSSREIEGFYLTWFEGAAERDRTSEALEVARHLEDSGVEDVQVESVEEGISLSIQNIHFVPDQAVILPSERFRLDRIAEALAEAGDRSIKAVGHTADIGTAESQYVLSVERARVMIEEMVKRGIPPERFIFEGKGGSDPIGPNDTEEGRAANRRVEFVILDG